LFYYILKYRPWGKSVAITEIQSKSILIKRARIDSWFLAGYGMNLYRGCAHSCAYCDGQAEDYRVEGVFGQDIGVKSNALELLPRELDPARRRRPFNKGFVLVGGGVGDSYQPIEKQYRLTRGTLELLAGYGHPVQLLTKSTLVLRDIDLLKVINQRSRAIVSFSFSSVDKHLCALFEPGVPPPDERLAAIRELKKAGLTCGMFLMPVIPYLTDSEEQIAASVAQAKAAGVDFIIFGGMTLKEGRQKDYFLNVLRQHFPDLAAGYAGLYPGDRWGGSKAEYYQQINHRFLLAAQRHLIPMRIPISLCQPFVSENELVYLILDQMDYLMKMRGSKTTLGYLAYQIAALKTPLRGLADFSSLKGVNTFTGNLMREVLATSNCRQYQALLQHQ
jgi:DNA repair photolyase